MEMKINLPGGKKVEAQFKSFTVITDQPEKLGGNGTAPSPTELFLASIGTCAGYFAMIFCEKRNLNMDGLDMKVDFIANRKTYMIEKVVIDVSLPVDFPEKYKEALGEIEMVLKLDPHHEGAKKFRQDILKKIKDKK